MRSPRALVAAALLAVASARAAPGSTPEQEGAFKAGFEQYEKGNYAGAIATWESLLSTLGQERGYKVLYNLGLAYEASGDVTRAMERYGAFVERVEGRAPELAKFAEDAKKRMRAIDEAYGRVNVAAPKRGGLVLTRVGTSEPRAAGYVVYLAPGRHVVELFVGTDHVKALDIDVQRGQHIEIDSSPPEEAPPAPAPRPAPAPVVPAASAPEGRSSTWLLAGGIATAASFALPFTLYFVARGKQDDARALDLGRSDYPAARDSYDRARTAYAISWVLPATIAVVSVVGYLLSSPKARTGQSVLNGLPGESLGRAEGAGWRGGDFRVTAGTR